MTLPSIDRSKKLNGDLNDEEKKKMLELEYHQNHGGSSNGNGKQQQLVIPGDAQHKVTSVAQAQGNVVKVAMYGEFAVPNE